MVIQLSGEKIFIQRLPYFVPCYPAFLANIWLVYNQLTDQRASSLWLSVGIRQEYKKSHLYLSLREFLMWRSQKCFFFFPIFQYTLIINLHYLHFAWVCLCSSSATEKITYNAVLPFISLIIWYPCDIVNGEHFFLLKNGIKDHCLLYFQGIEWHHWEFPQKHKN